MGLTPGTRLGVYEITSLLGEGGMGSVYRATDTTLGRQVAIKILPDAFAADPDRVARFEREAKTLAALNHPHIAAIYGFEKSAGLHALVMELVEGEDLSQRIARGAIPIDEALPIAKQIAEALEAAHEQGIIHRDLKPANIKVRSDGTVKVLDFGLAKAMEPAAGSSPSLSMSPTITTPAMTQAGMILGTAAYMSPEQARGKVVDKRTDIWAFGCVLFEMLTGQRAFAGDDVSEVLASVLAREPDFGALPAGVPARVGQVLRVCLQKDPRQRAHDIADIRLALEGSFEGNVPLTTASASAPRGARALMVALGVAGIVIIAMAAPTLRHLRETPPPEMRLEMTTPPTSDLASLAISPDGLRIVFAATSEGQTRLWLRSFDAGSTRPLAGTDYGRSPFWSPDSRSIGFFVDGALKRIDIDGGSIEVLASASAGRGGTWNRDGTILFAPSNGGPIFRVSAAGGQPSALTRLETGQGGHRFPQFLPDGHQFLYYVLGSADVRGVYVGQIDGSAPRRLLDADAAAAYTASGQLLFVRKGTLFAQGFDAAGLRLSGTPVPVADQVAVNLYAPALSASTAGLIAYRTGSQEGRRRLIWTNRAGEELGVLSADSGMNAPTLSPDGLRVASFRLTNRNFDIWLLDTVRGVFSRFTSDAANDNRPVWSSDGSRIVFSSNRKGSYDLYQKAVTGSGGEEVLLATPFDKAATDWSRDGRFLLFWSFDPKTSYDIWALPLDGTGQPFPVVRTSFNERNGQFSPDGKWIAYESDESGNFEVYIQQFPGAGNKSQVSTGGGAQARWRHDGKELFYLTLDGRLMAAPIGFDSTRTNVVAGTPVPLFAAHVGPAVQPILGQRYMVAPDDQRFLLDTENEEISAPITIIQNWRPDAKP